MSQDFYRISSPFVARAPHGHRGWRVFDIVYVMRLDEDGYPITFKDRDSARAYIGLKLSTKVPHDEEIEELKASAGL